MRPLAWSCLVSILALCLAARPAEPAAQTSLALHSETGDYVGQGLDYNYTTTQGGFSVQRNVRNGVTVTFTAYSGAIWKLEFAAPGNQALATGVWLDAQAFASGDPARAGLAVTGFGRSCAEATGSFQVKQITYGSTGNVTALWVLFAQHCNGATSVLSGDLRYRAELPVFVCAPPALSIERGQEVFFDAQAGGTSTGTISLLAGTLPTGASFSDNGNRTGSFDWWTVPDQVGMHVLTFHAADGLGGADSAVSVVTVLGLTGLRAESDPGDVVGQGQAADYSGESARFTASEENGSIVVHVTSAALTDAWTLTFAAPGGAPLAVGDYLGATLPDPSSGHPGLLVSRNGSTCSDVSGEFQVQELVRDASGLTSFRASFEQRCAGSTLALRGEVRVNAAVPIDITAPFGMTVDPGQAISFYVLASDPFWHALSLSVDGMPAGASFIDYGDNSGLFTWTPADPDAGLHRITFGATDGTQSGSFTTRIWVTGTVTVAQPVAVAGGPYAGMAGDAMLFDGSGSSSPDGSGLVATWDFGDGTSSTGLIAQHGYGAAGTYRVVLTVCNATLCDTDSTTAVVTAPPTGVLAARARPDHGDNPIRLGTGKPEYTVLLEPVDAAWPLIDLDYATLALISQGTGSVERISPVSVHGSYGRDRDHNGVADLQVTFTAADLRNLLSGVTGRADVPFRLAGELLSGGSIEADFTMEVFGNASVRGRGRAQIRFALEQPDYVRVQLFDLAGRRVAVLLDDMVSSGEHVISADGAADGPAIVPGVYFYRVETSHRSEAGRVVVTR